MSQLERPAASPPTQALAVAAGIIITIGALYIGAGIFVPLVLAVLLTFALAPIVRLLHRLHIPHVLAVLLSVLAAAAVIGFLAYLIITQLGRLAGELPNYQQIVSEKVRALQSIGGGEVFDRLASAIQSFGAPGSNAPMAAENGTAIPVTVVNPPESPFDVAQMFLGSLLGPLATAAIVTVFVIFLLLERGDFRDRFLKLVSRGDLRTTTKVINEAGRRVSRYLLVQFSVNMSYGLVFGTGLFLIGVPNAILWGLFAAMFRYIPFVGTLIAASLPFALAFAIDPGWGMLVKTVALYAALELTITNAIEPRLYGSSTGLSALAVIVAAMFWATLWGPIGLILATPLTVCLVVLGRYVPQLHFLEILLGSEPVLVREEQLYQRLLAGNLVEAIELAESYVSSNSKEAFFDDVAFPALRLAEADRVRNLTDVGSRRMVADGMAALIRDIEPEEGEEQAEGASKPIQVLCIGGRTELDGAAAAMIAQVIGNDAFSARTLPPISVRPEEINHLDITDADAVCLVYLDLNPRTYAKFVAKRLKRRNRNLKIIACLPNAQLETEELAIAGIDHVATTSTGVRSWMQQLAAAHGEVEEAIGFEQPNPVLVSTLRSLTRSGDAFDALVNRIKDDLEADLVMVTPYDEAVEIDENLEGDPAAKASIASLANVVVEQRTSLLIGDVAHTPQFSDDAFLLINNVQSYAGVPLFDNEGKTFGVLSILFHEQQKFDKTAVKSFESAANDLARSLSQQSGADQTPPPSPAPVPAGDYSTPAVASTLR